MPPNEFRLECVIQLDGECSGPVTTPHPIRTTELEKAIDKATETVELQSLKPLQHHVITSCKMVTPYLGVFLQVLGSCTAWFDMRQIFHWGASNNRELYIQETGRSGRDEFTSILFFSKEDERFLSLRMLHYSPFVSLSSVVDK